MSRSQASGASVHVAGSASFSAIALMITAVALFALLDGMGKHLSEHVHVLQVVWMRFATHLVFAFFFMGLWRDLARLKTGRPWMQGLRGILLLSTTIFNFIALQYLQLAETSSIMFAAPIVVAALAVPLLGEYVGIRRWVAIAVGFVGVLVVTRPGLDGLGWPALISVGSMLSFALYSLATRVLAQTENERGLVFYSAAVPAVAMMPIGLSVWVWPEDLLTWFMLLTTGVVGGVGHWLLIRAHKGADASALSPFIYTQIVWMVGIGWLWFGDVPTAWTILGATIIIGSGLYILYRETRAKGRLRPGPTATEVSS